jgi:hypothetical protein
LQNTQQNPLFIVEDIVVPETQKAKALALQVRITAGIGFAAMLPAVRLYDQPMPKADEVDDEAVNWDLALEFVSRQSLPTQHPP